MTLELLKLYLPIEPDVYTFAGLTLTAVERLGGNAFLAARNCLGLLTSLRQSGAGRGLPICASLVVDGPNLWAEWGHRERQLVVTLPRAPSSARLSQLSQYFQQATEQNDPALLLRRNQQMMLYLEENRQRMEAELKELHETLDQRQEELWCKMREAETDPLTGLLNRRAYDDRLEKSFRRTTRQSGEVMSLLLLDLDHFKQVNDQYGHQFGDAYLNKMAQAMMEVIREDVDMAFRIGGDEFAMILFADRSTACRKGLEVIAAMSGKVSIGIATLEGGDPEAEKLTDFVKRADDALYAAKDGGRGRVMASHCQNKPGHNGCVELCSIS